MGSRYFWPGLSAALVGLCVVLGLFALRAHDGAVSIQLGDLGTWIGGFGAAAAACAALFIANRDLRTRRQEAENAQLDRWMDQLGAVMYQAASADREAASWQRLIDITRGIGTVATQAQRAKVPESSKIAHASLGMLPELIRASQVLNPELDSGEAATAVVAMAAQLIDSMNKLKADGLLVSFGAASSSNAAPEHAS